MVLKLPQENFIQNFNLLENLNLNIEYSKCFSNNFYSRPLYLQLLHFINNNFKYKNNDNKKLPSFTISNIYKYVEEYNILKINGDNFSVRISNNKFKKIPSSKELFILGNNIIMKFETAIFKK